MRQLLAELGFFSNQSLDRGVEMVEVVLVLGGLCHPFETEVLKPILEYG